MTNAVTDAIDIAADMCAKFEGFYSKPYICPAGYWTIGYGTVFKPDGSRVTAEHLPISEAVAYAWLMHELSEVAVRGVLAASPHLIQHPNVLAAMADFTYNLGIGRYRASTLRRRIDAKNWSGAKQELAKWIRGGGRVLPGLVRRRAAEAALLG